MESSEDWRGLYRLGGILAVLLGFGGLAASRMGFALYGSGYPTNPEAYLKLVSQHELLANGLWSLWIIGDFVSYAPTVAFYLVLRRNNRILALLGTLFVGFYLFYDVSVTALNSLTLVRLSRDYANAATDALRASYVAAATYGYAALPLQTVLSFGVGAVGWLLWSVIMLKGRTFPRWVAGGTHPSCRRSANLASSHPSHAREPAPSAAGEGQPWRDQDPPRPAARGFRLKSARWGIVWSLLT